MDSKLSKRHNRALKKLNGYVKQKQGLLMPELVLHAVISERIDRLVKLANQLG